MKKKILSINNLKKVYKNGDLALNGIDLEVNKGSIFGLLGPNGAGKSTLISIVTTTLAKSDGTVELNGFNLDKDPDKIRATVGVIFQDSIKEAMVTGYEVLQNQGILYGMNKEEIKSRSKMLLRQIGLEDVANNYVETYSGGMRRKLEVIKGILPEPEILFLDEPTLGVDTESRLEIWSLLNDMKKYGTTIFVTSHYIDEIEKNADYVAIINSGEIKCMGSTENLLKEYRDNNCDECSNLEDLYLYFSKNRKED